MQVMTGDEPAEDNGASETGEDVPIRARLTAIGQQFYALSHPDVSDDGSEAYELVKQLGERGFEREGWGGGRRVFRLPPDAIEAMGLRRDAPTGGFVVKFALHAVGGMDGRTQNRREMELSEDPPWPFDEYILPVSAGEERGFWVIQPYAEQIEEATPELFEAVGAFSGLGYGSDFSEEHNWGRVNGRLRLIDFGYLNDD